jgi:DNA gyrase subunit A
MNTASPTVVVKGVKTINVTEKTGRLVGMLDVTEKEDLMITCKSGVTIRMKVADISEQGRATQGVKLIRIDEGDEIAAITRIDIQEEEIIAELETTEPIISELESTEPTIAPENPSEEINTDQP